MNAMIRKKEQGVEWLEFELLANEPRLKHGVFLRHGGVSEGPYASLNVGGNTGDNPEHIEENRARVKRVLGVNGFVSGKQVHGATITHVDDETVAECDGLVTRENGRALLIKHADCQAAIFYDPILHVVANIHCGWRGNVHNIYAGAVAYFRDKFDSKPENLLVGISPSLGPQNAEFKNYESELPRHFWDFQIRPTYFDLWEISRMQLLEVGILPHHLQIASVCTHASQDDFFSYRRDKPTGRNATVALITSPSCNSH